jgi:hypothetical protein
VLCLLSWREWLRDRRSKAVLWFVAGLLAKEEAVGFPLFIALFDASFSRLRSTWKPVAAMLAFSVLFGVRVLYAASSRPGSGAGLQAGISGWDYFWTQGLVIWRYFAMVFLPFWPYRIDSPVQPGFYWWAWLALLGCAALAAMKLKNHGAGLWLLGALLLVLPSSSIFPAADLAADRRMYLPLLAAGAAVAIWMPRFGYFVPVLAILSFIRTYDWLDEERFWWKQARSGSVRSQVQLGRLVETPEARRILEGLKKKNPDNTLIASELGRVYVTSGELEMALIEFGRALALEPNSPQALSNRGFVLLLMKQETAARGDFERALEIDPCAFEARLNAKRLGMTVDVVDACRYSEDQRKALAGP